MPVKLNDYSFEVKAALNDISKQWLHEAGFEVESHAKRNCKLDGQEGSKLRGSYKSIVDEGAGEAMVGSPLESVYWEEFGTGSHAAHGGGRSGWWVYVKNGETRTKKGKTYGSQAEAQEVADSMQAQGIDAYATDGRDPSHTLENAFKITMPKAERLLEQMLKEGMQ